jgi:hypothetical protein
MKNIFVITLATLGLLWACQKENNVVSPNNIIGKWEYVKVEFYELSETGEKTNFIENADSQCEYHEIDVPHTLEITDTYIALWLGDRFPSEEVKYVLEDENLFLQEEIGRSDRYVIKTLNKKEMVLLGEEVEFEFRNKTPEIILSAYPFIYYRRIN